MLVAFFLAGATAVAAAAPGGANPTINEHGVIRVYGQVVPSAQFSSKDDPIVCKRYIHLGSHFAVRNCRLKSVWRESPPTPKET